MSLPRELWTILTPTQRRQVLGAQAISLAMAASGIVSIAAIAPFFAALADPQATVHLSALRWLYLVGGFTSTHTFVTGLAIAFVALVIASNLVNALGARAMNRIAHRIGNELQGTLFAEYLSRPYLFHVCVNSATLFNNVVNEAGRLNEGVLQNLFTLITNATTGCVILVSVIVVSPAIALALLAGLGGGYCLIYLSVRARLLRLGRAHSLAWSEQARIVGESFSGIKEILLLADKGRFQQQFERASVEAASTAGRIRATGQVPRHVMECVALSALASVALVLNIREAAVGRWLAELSFLGFATYRLLPVLQQLFISIVRIRADRTGFTAIAKDLRRARTASLSPAENSASDPWPGAPREEIRLVRACFHYSADGRAALVNANLRIPAGAMVGIVGPNGSGKTTLMDVIVGLLPPTSGEVRIDGIAITAASRPAWLSKVAYVPQNLFLLEGTLAENIAFGVRPDAIDRARITRAAHLAQLDEFVAGLPRGYEHAVGERGMRLSGGERQKIGIARALYRGASVLLFDEATSALDNLAETEILAALRALRRSCTILLISHRASTLGACDLIVRLEAGRIVTVESERGPVADEIVEPSGGWPSVRGYFCGTAET
jgi:ATP-binding cassette, subfamily B, bacterial PglK